jgi:hypothetical protein
MAGLALRVTRSSLIDTALDRILNVALELLGLALHLLANTLALKASIAGGLADTFFHFTDSFVGMAFDFVFRAAHVTPHLDSAGLQTVEPCAQQSFCLFGECGQFKCGRRDEAKSIV